MKLLLKILVLSSLMCGTIYANTFDIKDKDSWLGLLKNKKYTLLDSELQKLYDNIQQDITKEPALNFALNSFNNSALHMGKMLQDWKKEKPDSLFALTAWGMYNTNIAFLSRGGDYRKNTTTKQISKMVAYFREARDALNFVIKKDPKFTVAIKYLLLKIQVRLLLQ